MANKTEIVFPRSLSDLYPAQAQKLYIDAYKQSLATSVEGSATSLSREGVASRDAWEAVQREYVQDSVTHKILRIGDPVGPDQAKAGKRSLLDAVKGMFAR